MPVKKVKSPKKGSRKASVKRTRRASPKKRSPKASVKRTRRASPKKRSPKASVKRTRRASPKKGSRKASAKRTRRASPKKGSRKASAKRTRRASPKLAKCSRIKKHENCEASTYKGLRRCRFNLTSNKCEHLPFAYRKRATLGVSSPLSSLQKNKTIGKLSKDRLNLVNPTASNELLDSFFVSSKRRAQPLEVAPNNAYYRV